MPDNRYYYFKDAKGNRHTVNKAAFDNDREGFAKAFPGARMEVIDRKTGRRGDVDVKDAGRVGDFGAHLFTGQTVRREKYQPKTSLGKAALRVAQKKWGKEESGAEPDYASLSLTKPLGNEPHGASLGLTKPLTEGGKESALVKGLREADALKRRDEEQMPIDYTKPSAVKQMVGRTHREQQTLDRRIEQAGREAGKSVEGEIRRQNAPAFDLGNGDVNNNIVKTRGQLEKDMEKSGSKFVDDEFSKYISDVFKKEDEAAFERGQNAALNVIASSPSNAVFGTTRARNEEMSPEKRLANITKEIEGNIHNLFSSSNVAERIKAEATKLGVSPDDYVEHTLVPSLMNKVSSDFDKTELKSLLPSGAIETILMHTQNSMTGALASMGLMTKSQRQYGQRALSETLEGNNPKYNPGLGTRVAGSTLSFMMDMAPIGMAEKPAVAVAGKLFGNGVAQTARIANSTLGGRIARMAGSGMVSQGITGVLYGSTNAAVQNYSTGDDTSIGNTVKVMTMGGLSEGASWATMGGIGGAVGAGIYNVSGVKRIPAKAFQLAMEGIGMHMGGNVAKTIEGHDTDWLSVEGNLEACANVVALKLTHARLPKRQSKDGVKESYLDMVARNINGLMTSDGQRAAFGGYTFTNEEKEQLFGSASAPKRNESIYGYDAHNNPLTRKESLTSWAMRAKKTAAKGKGKESYKDTDAEFVKTAYDEIMADNTIPWDTKAKFSALVMGTVPSARPMMENCRIEGGSVNEYSKNGELLSKNSFKSIDERNSIIYSLNMKREDQRLNNAYGAAQIKDEKTAQATLEAVAEANGMTAEQLKTAMYKQPLRRSDEEQNACVALRKAYEDEQFVPGTLHAEQSNTEGKDVVEENGLGTETPNNEAASEVLGDLTKTEDALQTAMDSNDVLKEEYERMQKAGMSNPQIYMELFNAGLTQEQLAPLADYINTLSKAQGMFKGTHDKIVETTQKHVGQWSYKGELNGEKQNGEQMVFVKDDKGRVLIVGAGDVAFDGEGRARENVGDMLSVLDPATMEMDFVSKKDVQLDHVEKTEDYAKNYQTMLEVKNSEVYAKMQPVGDKPNEASSSLPKPGEQPKGKAPKPEGEEAKSDTGMYKPDTDPLLFTVEKNGRAEQYDVTPHIKVNNEGGKIITFSGVTTFVKGAPKGHNEGETRNRPNGVAFIRINPDNIDYERYVYEDAKEQDGTPMKKEDVTEEDIAEAKEDIDFIFNRAGTGPVYNILKIIVTPDGRVYGETVDGYVVPLKKNPLESSDKYKESLNKKPVPTFADGTPVPMIKDSKNRETADYSQMSPEQGAEWMSSQFGENAEAAVDGQIKRAEKTLKDAEKIKVDYTGDLNDAKEAEAQKTMAVDAAKKELELYTNIKKAMTEKKVKAGMEKVSGVGSVVEVGSVGSVGVAREKFKSGLRVVGNKRTRTLADGSKLRGHYEIVDADSLTPSHNANDGYKKSEGFPVNEEGMTINDRDYENDKQAQLVTDMIAMKYDGQAVDQVPVVTSDGIVVDGNGRTMAGQKAAKNGTDSAYLEALKENAENYGFTAEQIEQSGIKHPRLVLVSDEPMKYDTATFAKFNKNEKKAQGNTQQAVANSKKLSADEISAIVSEIEGSGSLDAFFNNPSAINSLLTRLVDKGVIGLNEVAGLREGEDKLSAAGKDFVKNLLLGSVFSENTIRMMGADAMLKTKALNGIRAVTDNMKLGDYALMKEIDKAVQLLYEARQGGSGVDAYLRTPAMFGENAADRYDPISQAIALALEGKVEDFRELMMAYNRNAAPYADANQTEMFGERPTKEDFVNEFLKLRNWKDYETRHSSKEGNGDAGGTQGSEPQAPGGSEPTEGQREVDKAVKRIATEITKKTGIEVVTDEKEAEEVIRESEETDSDLKYHKETNEATLEELENGETVKEFRTAKGEVYGFTDGEKIYLDTRKMKPETPLHEYAHLWCDMLRKVNPNEWENVKKLFDKVESLKEEVKKLYPELKDDALYEEMITTYSGREGTKKLEDVVRKLAAEEGKSVTESAKAQGFLEKVKVALTKYWKGVADVLGIHFTTAEEVADKVLADWASGYNPKDKIKDERLPITEEEWLEQAHYDIDGDRPADKDIAAMIKTTNRLLKASEGRTDIRKNETTNSIEESIEIDAEYLFPNERDWFSPKKYEDYASFVDDETKAVYDLIAHKDAQGHLKSVTFKKETFAGKEPGGDKPSEASLSLPKPGDEKGLPEGDGKALKANPLEGMRKAAELFKDEQIEKARAELAEAKKSGDASEVKRLTDKLKGFMDSKLRGNGIGLVERRKIIGEELGKVLGEEAGKAEAEKVDKPWEQMDLEEREAVSSKNPLTETEINELTSEENRELIPAALAYLRGDKSNIINAISYFKIWNDVRSRHENVPDNSGAKDGTQLDAPNTGGSQELGLERGRESGRPDEPVDRGAGNEAAPGERNSREGNQNDTTLSAGEQGNKQGEGNTSRMGTVPAGGSDTRGGGRAGNEGNVPKRGGQGGGNRPLDPNAGRKPAAKQGTHFPDSTSERLKQERAEYEQKKKDFWERWKKAGQGYMKISLTPFKALNLSPEQIEMLPELFKMHLNGAVLKIKEGIYKFNEWKAAMRAEEGEELKMIGLSDDDIDRFIEDYWNTPYQMDGETHTIGEWAGIHGNEKLRNKLSEPLNDKYQRQVAAEPIKVKIGDKKNIEETLPYLLPQQQEDVLRAETQFFGNEHADREHAYGKGYMFTNGTGTGKTFTGLGVAKRLVKQGKGRILIVTPSQKKVSDWIKDGHNLNMEIRDLDSIAKERGTTATTESGEGVVITTFANFGVNKKLLETKWDAVIYDESHRIMENKNGTETARSMQHYMVTNRSENHCFLRLQETNKDYQKMKSLGERFDAERDKEVKRIQDEYKASHPSATPRDVAYATSRMLPKERNGFTPGDYASFPKLGNIHAEFVKALSHYTNEVEPKLKAQAKAEWKDTKTIFLSATPFNTRENLDYAEGYIFKYPEVEKGGRISGRTQFYLDHFGAAYKFRYNRLEQSTSNPEAVAKQEIEFSDYLQHTLGTMSGRIIDSPYDYSRDFPTVSPDHAEEFNQAVQDAVRGHGVLADAYRRTIGDYNYGSALFETMKVANIIERIKAHLDAGRKVVIFHRRVETKEPLKPPFAYLLEQANFSIALMKPGEEQKKAIQAVKNFRKKYADLLEWEQTLDYSMPREQIAKVFGKDKVLFFSGKESTKVKDKAVDTFNSDDSGKNIIVIQEASGKEGISLHDTTGKHQRVCITLALPQSPITALQIEGRTYRIGNKSNAIFEYPILGLNSEMMLFGQKFNNQVSTTENLALGSQARSLRDSFANGILEHSGVVPIEQQGVGGKEFDAPKEQDNDPFDSAVLDYYSNQKLNSRNREGVDYFPTPEPLGYKMMEWANMGEGDTVLEPSAGHGAIARYAPKGNQMVAIEPSQSLFTKLQLKAGGLGRKFQNTIFENYDISNKHDVVVMNPPFGTAGATAIAHLGKAFKHLEEGGRVVALIPRGSTDKKFEKWIEGEKTAVMRAEVELPDIVFKQAGTNVVCRVVVVDKISNEAMRAKAGSVEKVNLGGHYDKIEDFFEDLRDVEMPDRIIDTNAIMMKKSKQTVKDLKELKDVAVDFNEGGINVRVRGDWKDYSIPFDMEGYSAEQKKKLLASTYETFEQQERQTRNETSQAVLAELKKLSCKLAGMTEEEMQRYLKKKYEGKGVMYRIEHAAEVYNKAKGDASLGLSKPTEPLEGRIAETVEKVSKQTGGKVKMVNSVEEIGNEEVRRDIENGKQVTGWYDENTGEVHLYMPNIHDSYTAEKTVWHETVGHKGMRGLLGDKFNDYMRGLWMDLDNPMNAELRAYVKERMDKDSMGFYDAIEEFIAESAEKGKGEPGFWNNIKNKVTDALHEIGYRISPNVKDVKYMLWLAKNVQKKGNDPWWKMRADAVKWKIEHENVEYTKIHGGEFYENDGKNHDFEDMTKEEWDEATDGQIHYRTAPSAATALDRYHSMLNAHGYMATESFMDNMLSLDKLMRAVDPSIKKIEDVKSSMNPYVLQNTMQGAMSDKMTLFEHQVMKPLDKAMSDVLDSFAGKNTEEKIRECNLYMIGKHGLERNRVLFVRDKIREKRKVKSEESDSIDALEAAWNGEKNDLGQKLRSGQIDLREYYRQMDEWIVQNIDKDFKAEEHDYSGMHGLQEIDDLKSPYDDAGAIDSVMSQEAKMENQKKGSVDNLWNRIKDATNYSINSDYENGLMSEELRDRVASMFDWYVPLRKFDEATAEDVYGYISGEDGKGFIGETLMNAKGRKSLSDVNVLAQIGAMANRAIRNGGQNAVKQAFARFVRNSGEQNLVKETKVWVEKKGTDMNGNDIWEEAFPQIPDNASAHDIATIVDAFETDMKTKQAKGEAKTLSNSTDIGFKFARAKNKSEHFVDVKIAGRTHSFVVLGNPRAAQALNGMLENSSPNSALLKGLKSATRFMAQMATSYSPEFVMRNIIRDAEFASSNVTAKEGVRYGKKWLRYYAELNPLNVAYNEGAGALKSLKWRDLKEGVGMGLYARYREGTLGNSKMERYFKEFMQNGGETGWVQVKTMQEWEKEYKRDVSREHSKVAKTGKALRDFLVGNVENLNEVAENMARFATFCTSRDLGRSAVRSAYDAKQVSTNFNRHGSGDAIKTFKNGEMGTSKEMRRNVYGTIASYLRNYSMFFNAGVQSTHLLMNNVKKAPVGTVASMMAMPFGLGILAAVVNNAMIASEDEKKRKGVKDPYGELPEYIRRNNLCIYKGSGEFVTIPLAIELRAFYGLGDIAAGMTTAKNVKSTRNAAMDAVGCMSQLLPVVDFMNSATFDKEPGKELLKGVLPTAAAPFVEWWLNSDWKGTPIRREGDYTENRPAWMNAYSGTPEKLMDLNKWVNARTNDVAPGNENMRGNSLLDEATDPAMLNHIIGTLGGGAATFITRGTGLVLKYADGREQEIETKDIPFLRSLMYTPSEQTSMARTKAKWYSYKESMEKNMSNYSMLKNKNVPLTERIRNAADRHRFEQSADYARIRIIKDAEKQMKRWNKMKRLNADDKKQVDFANKNIEMIMQKAVEQMDGISEE